MSNTLMGTLQQAIRSTFGCANDFNGDLHVLADYWGIPMVPISGRTIDVARKYDTSITTASSALNYLLQNGANVVPGLALNFVSTSDTLDPRITFSRTSNATLFDSSGNLVYAPHNLLTQSESFDSSVWLKNATVITANSTVAPDGTTTADTISRSADGLANRHVRQNFSTTNLGNYTLSMYVKPEGETVRVALRLQDAAAVGGHCIFDLIGSGSIVSSSSAVGGVQKVGDWFRISVTVTFTSALTQLQNLLFLGGFGNSTDPTPFSIWGAQLNIGTLQPYDPTTVKNLLGFTQHFDNAAWVKSNATITANATAAPDGSVTADKLVENAGSVVPFTFQNVSVIAGTSYTFTCYAREDEASAKRYLMLLVTAGGFGANIRGVFDLQAGTFTTTGAGTVSMQSVGSGWVRCRITATATITALAGFQVRMSNVNDGSVAAYTGDGTSGIFIWGAQLSDSASLDEYRYNPVAAPTSTAYHGPRFDYDPVTLAARGLLIEEQRTNSIPNSVGVGAVAGTPGTLPTNWSVASSASGLTREIVGTGTENGITYIDVRFSGTSTSVGTIQINPTATTEVAALTGQTWTAAWYIRLAAGSLPSTVNWILQERDASGVAVVTAPASPFGPPTSSDLREQRYAVTRTLSGGASVAHFTARVDVNIPNATVVDLTLRIGLPQLELGAFATSVIPTTTAAATRTADVATMVGDNFANWYNASEGTLFAEALREPVPSGFFPQVISINDGTTDNTMRTAFNTATVSSFSVRSSDVFQADFNPPATGNTRKIAGAYKVDDFAASANGGAVVTDTSGTVPVVNQARLGATPTGASMINGHICRIAYYPRRLANSELQTVTA